MLSAQPSFDQKQILWKQYRLAMSFGAKPHYAFRQIAPRHFAETAERANLARHTVSELLEELCSQTPLAPQHVAASIAGGIRKRLHTLEAETRTMLRRNIV